MKRREFITLLGGAAAWPLAARAAKARPRIAVLSINSAASESKNIAAFVEGLRVLGHVEGQTADIDYRYVDGDGEIGIIASVTVPFCGACTRSRLTADGQLFTCLFAVRGHDMRSLLRSGATDEEIGAFLRRVWGQRTDRYSEIRSSDTIALEKVEMSRIGG